MKLPSFYCHVCGILKGKNADHTQCSKRLKKIGERFVKSKAKIKGSGPYTEKRINCFLKLLDRHD
jgi:hypothetical protein